VAAVLAAADPKSPPTLLGKAAGAQFKADIHCLSLRQSISCARMGDRLTESNCVRYTYPIDHVRQAAQCGLTQATASIGHRGSQADPERSPGSVVWVAEVDERSDTPRRPGAKQPCAGCSRRFLIPYFGGRDQFVAGLVPAASWPCWVHYGKARQVPGRD